MKQKQLVWGLLQYINVFERAVIYVHNVNPIFNVYIKTTHDFLHIWFMHNTVSRE